MFLGVETTFRDRFPSSDLQCLPPDDPRVLFANMGIQLLATHSLLSGTTYLTPGPLFCWPDGRPISRSFSIIQLNNALQFNNLDASLYQSHGFRIGAASWAAAKGFSDSQIRLLGR